MEAAAEGHEKIVQLFLQHVSLYVYLLNMSSHVLTFTYTFVFDKILSSLKYKSRL